ncbi:bifunctional UDP-N-acetylglucosamine diphosphorylase/glucosamine-1-phosphate N-acetyltransferase GlmU [uncultured Desulfovibrio sp.]|uniref:bifunctional UDP-N-acetylglucosamine diphosphorylase/glucosamine-1-phosphate N-acetyltransferase GlmU n=1 Tax=uncultured Desulfovibrio sp. TaxID=167968 RepID=UPI0032085D81
MPKEAALILAAGKGTRMHSRKPKVLQTLLGESMLRHVREALRPVFGENVWIVVGHGSDMVRAAFPEERFVLQEQQLGTGHALQTAMPDLEAAGVERLLVVNGDTPLITAELVRHFREGAAGADVAFATIVLDEPGAYGRVVRNDDGSVRAIVEAKDYCLETFGAATGEVNAGMYSLKREQVARLLPGLTNANKSGEYYITDLVSLAVAESMTVMGVQCGNDTSLLGINSPLELSRCEEILRRRVNTALLASGVMLHAPESVRISPLAVVEPGVEITGPCEIYGRSVIRGGASIASHCVIRESEVAAGADIRSFCHLERAEVGPDTQVGPYARLRPGAVLEAESHVGNFVELKKARLGRGAKANHLTYLGDADIGAGSNIGAGTITCNYDGKNKFQTRIGERAFIGSNTALVAPVRVGADTLIGAGSVITRDVPDGEMGIARGRQKNLPRRG